MTTPKRTVNYRKGGTVKFSHSMPAGRSGGTTPISNAPSGHKKMPLGRSSRH